MSMCTGNMFHCKGYSCKVIFTTLLVLHFSSQLLFQAGAQNTVYITPDKGIVSSTGNISLDECVRQPNCFTSNTNYIFLDGKHSLSISATISDITDVLLKSQDEAKATIECSRVHENIPVVLNFSNIDILSLQGLVFEGCNFIENHGRFLSLVNIISLSITSLVFTDGWGIEVLNPLHSLFIEGVIFNRGPPTVDSSCTPMLRILFDDHAALESEVHVSLVSLLFDDSICGSLYVKLSQSTYDVKLNVSTLVSKKRSHWDPPLHVTNLVDDVALILKSIRPNAIEMHGVHMNGRYSLATGIHITQIKGTIDGDSSPTGSVLLQNLLISGYQQGGLMIFIKMHSSVTYRYAVNDSTITTNSNDRTHASAFLYNVLARLDPPTTSSMSISNVTFLTNVEDNYVEGWGKYYSTALLVNANNVFITNCDFTGNIGSGLVAFNSNITLGGSVTFANNTGFQGGAMALYDRSYIQTIPGNNTNVLYRNNTARKYGGAIYVDSSTPLYVFQLGYILCFWATFHPDTRLTFIDNTAVQGGNAIFGGLLERCKDATMQTRGSEYMLEMSHFEPSRENDTSVISSLPNTICHCDNYNVELCSTSLINISVYHGEIFQINVVLVGDMNGTSLGTIYAQVITRGNCTTGFKPQLVQHNPSPPSKACTTLFFSVLTLEDSEIIIFSPTAITMPDSIYYTPSRQKDSLIPLYLNVSVHDCPDGFHLNTTTAQCVCHLKLQAYDVVCNITNDSVERRGSVWIGIDESTNKVLYSQDCKLYNCKQAPVIFSLHGGEQDLQCINNHSGVLCGGCQDGLSLTLGTLHCVHCSDSYLGLLLAFAAAGIFLVVFIKLFNLTVSEATLNGTVLYANIVWTNRLIIFPENGNLCTRFLYIFMAWINLDLGIETCLYDGLNRYQYHLLQYVFSIYLFSIALFIIAVSHYSTTASRLFGRNSISLLASLFLLSFHKIVHTVTSALSGSIVHILDTGKTLVWAMDGNIGYFERIHIAIFFISVLVFFLACLPLIVLVTFFQCIRRTKTDSRPKLKWLINKLTPFLETYTGPLKPKHRYWVGALLVVRMLLYLSNALVLIATPELELAVITVTVILLLSYLTYTGSMYKRKLVSLLEQASLINLGSLAVVTLYTKAYRKEQNVTIGILIGIAFLQFLLVIAIHVYSYSTLKKLRKGMIDRRWWFNMSNECEVEGYSDIDQERSVNVNITSLNQLPPPNLQARPRNASERYRESLLMHLDD